MRGPPVSEDARRLRSFARQMRSTPTEAEERLWGALRNRRLDKLKFRRQVPVGAYIADFICMEAKLIVEVDASSRLLLSLVDELLHHIRHVEGFAALHGRVFRKGLQMLGHQFAHRLD